jgi:hypothetical protein
MGEVTSPTIQVATPSQWRLDIRKSYGVFGIRKRKREERKIRKSMNELFILEVLNLLLNRNNSNSKLILTQAVI